MDAGFRLLAVLVALYVLYGLATGEVYAKSGIWGRRQRDESPLGYWGAIGSYSVLALMLAFLF
jgi:hypothetical protein